MSVAHRLGRRAELLCPGTIGHVADTRLRGRSTAPPEHQRSRRPTWSSRAGDPQSPNRAPLDDDSAGAQPAETALAYAQYRPVEALHRKIVLARRQGLLIKRNATLVDQASSLRA